MLLTAIWEFQPASTWKHERTQAELLFRDVREIGAVDAAAHADDAVEVPACRLASLISTR